MSARREMNALREAGTGTSAPVQDEIPHPQEAPHLEETPQHEEEIRDEEMQNQERADEEDGYEDTEIEDVGANPSDDELQDSFPGGPVDPSVLPSFKSHVAAAIWNGQERIVLKCHCHTSKLLKWTYSEGDDAQLWRSMLRHSTLKELRQISYKRPNRSLITSFVERWQPETNTFHLPFGEMTITLEDVYFLTGLTVAGKPVQSEDRNEVLPNVLVRRMLGVSAKEATEALGGKRGNSVAMNWLRSRFEADATTDSPRVARNAARAYLLYTLGCTIFSDKSGDRISVNFLKLLEDPQDVKSYAWGAAALAHMYRQLGCASRAGVRQISGYLTLLEVTNY